MRAAAYVGDQTIRVEEREPVEPAPGQVRLDVAYVGICGTDLHIKHGAMDARVTLPATIGHEMSGTVAAVGEDVTAWSTGERVTVMPLQWCDECAACRAGHRHVCERLVFVGIDTPGALQQSWTIDQDLLVRLPEHLPLDQAALAEPLAVAVHDVRRSGLATGARALVVGGGPIDLLAEDVASAVDEWTDGAGADVAFEVSTSGPGLAAATQAMRVRGRLVVVAIHSQPVALDLFRVFWRELEVAGARVYQRTDFERAVELLAAGAIPAAPLISAVVPLERTADAFAALEGGGDVLKVLIDCQTQAAG